MIDETLRVLNEHCIFSCNKKVKTSLFELISVEFSNISDIVKEVFYNIISAYCIL